MAETPNNTVLRLNAIRKSYLSGESELEVLHGIDLTLERGEFAALIGPSGSGKSTLLNLIGLLDRPTAGQLFIDGEETSTLAESSITKLRGQRIGFVFQHHCLIPAFSALENVMMPLLVDRGRPDAAMRQRAAELWQREQADARWKQLIAELRQRTPVRIDESHYAPTRGSGEKPRAG